MIKAKIDVTLIDKSRFYIGKPSKRDGHIPKYCSIAIIELPQADQFGNTHMVVEDVTKQEREAGKKGTILGNGKEFTYARRPAAPQNPPARPAPRASDSGSGLEADVPF